MRRLRYFGRLFGEVFAFAREHKVYWILPMAAILLLIVLLVVTSQGAAPFVYTLF